MINRERFEQLAAVVSCGEATAEEHAEFLAAISAEPSYAAEWKENTSVDCILRQAILSPDALLPIPSEVLTRLKEMQKQAHAAHAAAETRAREADNIVTFESATIPPGSIDAKRRHSFGTWLALAAAIIVLLGMAGFWFTEPGSKGFQPSSLLAPRGEIGVTRPVLVWDAKADERYDVWVLPAEGSHVDTPALFIAKGVHPPLDFSELQPTQVITEQRRPTTRLEPGTDYRLLVCIANAGRIAGVAVPFRTSTSAVKSLPNPSLENAKQLAAENRPAEGLMLLAQLSVVERQRPEVQIVERELRQRLGGIASPASTPAP